ncbi:hypothetical protein VIBNISFn118_1230009 [Vibrio nigripulchritudo SFn118]|nr:hypothetical protein VIBNISFn118_1230009 [Vibrio nigripulchritudo SFn118]
MQLSGELHWINDDKHPVSALNYYHPMKTVKPMATNSGVAIPQPFWVPLN